MKVGGNRPPGDNPLLFLMKWHGIFQVLYAQSHRQLLECDDDGLSFTQEYIILYLRNIADSQIFGRTPKFSNLGVLLTPKK